MWYTFVFIMQLSHFICFVCLQSQYRFVCEAILKVYEEEIVKPCETEPPVEKEE